MKATSAPTPPTRLGWGEAAAAPRRHRRVSVDFQRLASVRARQRARRKREIGALTALVGAVMVVAAGWLAAPLIPGQLLTAFAPGLSALGRGAWLVDAAHGEAQGWVQTVEPDTGIIRVSSGFLGLMSIALRVTPDTLIVVGNKEGGFGDIRLGERVVAAYDVQPGALQARRVEVFLPGRHGGN